MCSTDSLKPWLITMDGMPSGERLRIYSLFYRGRLRNRMQSMKRTYEACLVYFADVSIAGWTFKERPDNLQVDFQKFPKAHLKVNHKKCQLFLKKEQ